MQNALGRLRRETNYAWLGETYVTSTLPEQEMTWCEESDGERLRGRKEGGGAKAHGHVSGARPAEEGQQDRRAEWNSVRLLTVNGVRPVCSLKAMVNFWWVF